MPYSGSAVVPQPTCALLATIEGLTVRIKLTHFTPPWVAGAAGSHGKSRFHSAFVCRRGWMTIPISHRLELR